MLSYSAGDYVLDALPQDYSIKKETHALFHFLARKTESISWRLHSANEADIVKLSPNYCTYLTEREEKEIDDQVIGQHPQDTLNHTLWFLLIKYTTIYDFIFELKSL